MLKMRFMCGVMAAAAVLACTAIPTAVKAEDIDGCLDDLDNMSPEEMYIMRHLEDLDNDGDIDEHDVDIVETLLAMGVLDDYETNLARDILHHAHQQERNHDVSVTGVYFDSSGVTLTPGQTFQDCAHVEPDSATNQGISYYSSNTGVAAVDQNGVITAIAPGSCIISAISSDGNYSDRACVNVNAAPEVIAQNVSDDATWMNNAAAVIQATAPGGTANLVATKPMSFNSTVIGALATRTDVSVLLAFPYKGHDYLMSIPAGYNLASKADKTGKVSFLSLSAVNDGLIKVIQAD